MATDEPPTFSALLRRYRVEAGLTQEALAERARMSWRGISDLERGVNRTPRVDTVALLVAALGLTPQQQAALDATVRR
jgi:transcriptional regulator with XRE-family HTH domain